MRCKITIPIPATTKTNPNKFVTEWIGELLGHMKEIDPTTVLLPWKALSKERPISDPTQVPTNLQLLRAYCPRALPLIGKT
jgi:hypothetical protein